MSSTPWQPEHDEFLYSLQTFLGKLYDELISKVVTKAKEILEIPTTPDVSFLVTDQEESGHREQPSKMQQNKVRFPLILFAVAGSGKTQSIINFMAANWGHYLVSGRIPDSSTHQVSMLSPRRGGASSDTQWLFELFERVNTERLHFRQPNKYGLALMRLLENRQMLMETWYHSTITNSRDSIYWLLFQTTCTPEFDLFKDTLKLRMLCLDRLCLWDRPTEMETLMETLPILPTIIDEAQNELDPFWSDEASLTNFLDAGSILNHMVSVSGTSLRIKECQKLVNENILNFTLPQDTEHQIASLIKAFKYPFDPQSLSHLTEDLIYRAVELFNARPGNTQLLDFLLGTEFMNIMGNFYYEQALRKAHEGTRELLENSKKFLIPMIGSVSQKKIFRDNIPILYALETKSSIKDDLIGRIFKSIDNLLAIDEYDLEPHLRSRFALKPVDDSSNLPSNLIISNQRFSALVSAHSQRLLRRIGYFCSLGEKTMDYKFWRNACPETKVFQSTEDTDGRRDFFLRAKTLLEKHVNVHSPTANGFQCAAGKAVGEFRQAFEEKVQRGDRSSETKTCSITRYSPLFHGRMRWSTVYIEHVFASYLLSDMPFSIKAMARDAAESIKSSLKGRIEVLQSQGHHLLLKDLYFTAIRADLLHRPSIFPRDTSARMITEGFALLDPVGPRQAGSTYAPKQKLSEPIVVDAVIEYLHDMESDDEDNLESVLRNFLFDNQDDASSFGKAAEYYFAWVRAT